MREERIKVGKSHTLVRERGGSEQEHGEERVDYTVKGRFKRGKEGQAKKASLGEVVGSMSG